MTDVKVLTIGLALILLGCSSNETVVTRIQLTDLLIEKDSVGYSIERDSISMSQTLPYKQSPATRIVIKIDKRDSVTITLLEANGNPVTKTFRAILDEGNYIVKPDFTDFKAGVYLFQSRIGEQSRTKKILIMK